MAECRPWSHAPANQGRVCDLDGLDFDDVPIRLGGPRESPVANLSALLRSFPDVRLRIAGHREETGDTVEDEGLSLVPADALEALLVKAGTPADRIPTWDFGSEEPQDTRGPGEEPAHRGAAREVVMSPGT